MRFKKKAGKERKKERKKERERKRERFERNSQLYRSMML